MHSKIILVCSPKPQPVVYPAKDRPHLVPVFLPQNHFGVRLNHFGVQLNHFGVQKFFFTNPRTLILQRIQGFASVPNFVIIDYQ